jgi:hypothetical protein
METVGLHSCPGKHPDLLGKGYKGGLIQGPTHYAEPKSAWPETQVGICSCFVRSEETPSKVHLCWVWWGTSIIPALRKWRQEDLKFNISLGYIVRPCLK